MFGVKAITTIKLFWLFLNAKNMFRQKVSPFYCGAYCVRDECDAFLVSGICTDPLRSF